MKLVTTTKSTTKMGSTTNSNSIYNQIIELRIIDSEDDETVINITNGPESNINVGSNVKPNTVCKTLMVLHICISNILLSYKGIK